LLIAALAITALFAIPDLRGQEDRDQANETEGIDYKPRLEGVSGSLRETAEASLNLFRLRDRKPSSLAALRARVDADVEIMENILKSEGYYAFRIEHKTDATEDPVVVELNVDPGPVYRLARYDVRYLDPPTDEALPTDPKAFGIELGLPARAKPIVDGQSHLIRLLGETGHPYAAVENRRVLVHHDSQTMSVELDVRAGPAVRIGSVSVVGADRVEEDYIRRLANLTQGETFSLAAIDDARRRMFGTGLFDSVTINWPQSYTGDGQVPVTVEVKERARRSIATGFFYSTTDGGGVDASWTHRNLFGRGERLELGARFAERELSAYADFLKPNVGQLDQNIIGRADLKDQETDAYDQQSTSATVGVQRKLSEHWKGTLSGSVEAANIKETNEPEQQYLIVGLPAQLAYDGSNDLFDPSEGSRLTFDVAPNQVTGDSTARFVLGSVIASTYYEALPDKRLILAARGRVASLLGAETDDIPASRRLYGGGGGSVRGYAYQGIGPLDANNEPTGGRSLVEMSFEARIRITDTIGVVPFIDGGSVSEDTWPSGDSYHWGAGIGLRYYTPIGPLRLDVATPLNRRPGIDDAFAIYVSLGQAF
jgi:translocation and assembly module TamA